MTKPNLVAAIVDRIPDLARENVINREITVGAMLAQLEPTATGIEAQVCEDIAQRQQVGFQKYGVSVANNPLALREWLNHAYQECLDQAVYLKRAMREMDDQWRAQLAKDLKG